MTGRGPTRSVHLPAIRVARMPERPASPYSPISSAESENGGSDSATAIPDHTAQKAKNQRAPRTAPLRRTLLRRNRVGVDTSAARLSLSNASLGGGQGTQADCRDYYAGRRDRQEHVLPAHQIGQPPAEDSSCENAGRNPRGDNAQTRRTARRRGDRPTTELNPAPTEEHAPVTSIAGPINHTTPLTAVSTSAAASARNCHARTIRGENLSTRGTSRARPSMYPTGPHASATPTAATVTPSAADTSAMAG